MSSWPGRPRAPQSTSGPEISLTGLDVPEAVAASLAEELTLLSDAGRLVLERAAVAGDPFEPELAAAAAWSHVRLSGSKVGMPASACDVASRSLAAAVTRDPPNLAASRSLPTCRPGRTRTEVMSGSACLLLTVAPGAFPATGTARTSR